jgi:hypothetical protein
MVKSSGRGNRRGGRVSKAPKALAALLPIALQSGLAKAGVADEFLSDARLETLTAEDAAQLLTFLAAIESPESLDPAAIDALLSADSLVELGFEADFVAQLLAHDQAEVLRQLKAAFAPKLKQALATAERKAFAADPNLKLAAQGAQAPSGDSADAQDSGGSGGISPMLAVAGVVGAGVAVMAVTGSDKDERPSAPVNVGPAAANDTATVAEDGTVVINVLGNDTDPNGDTLTVTQINGANVTAGTPVTLPNGVGTLTLGADGRLTFAPASNFNGTPSFTYTISDGKGGTATGTVNLTVTAVNDAPVNTVPTAAFAVNQTSSVAVTGITVADVDGGNLTTTLTANNGTLTIGTVTGGATVTNNGSGTVTLTGTAAQINASLGALSFNGGATFSGAATITVATSDGTATDTDTVTINVARVGVVSDGYISGATVFIDIDGDGVLDANEPTGTTNANGAFAINSGATGAVVAFGGTDVTTGLANVVRLTAPSGSTVVNPLTTLVQKLTTAAGGGLTVAQANAAVVAAFGLTPGTNLTTFDILAQPASNANALAAQKAAVQTVNLLVAARDAAGTGLAADAEAAVVAKLAAAAAAGPVNLTSVASLKALLTGIPGVTAAEVNAAALDTAGVNQSVAAATTFTGIFDEVKENAATGDVLEVTLSNAEAAQLISDGFTFAANDVVTLAAGAGTKVATDLKSLQALGVDAIAATGVAGAISIDMGGTGGFGALGASNIPQFDVTQNDAALDVTLNLNATPFAGVSASDFGALATALGNAGIDRLDIAGPQTVGSATLTDVQAKALIDAGLSFAAADNVSTSVSANGTKMQTSLQQLQALGIDSVVALGGVTAMSIDVGAGGLAALNAAGLPQFDVAQNDAALDVTLNVALTENLDAIPNLAQLAAALGAAGIDHIDVGGPSSIGVVTLDPLEAQGLVLAGLDFAANDDVTVVAAGTKVSTTLQDLGKLKADELQVVDRPNGKAVLVEFGDDAMSTAQINDLLNALDTDNNDATDLVTGSEAVALVVTEAVANQLASLSDALAKLAELGFTEVNVLDDGTGSATTLADGSGIDVKVIGLNDPLRDELNG